MKTNEFTYKVMDLNTAQLEIPRETYLIKNNRALAAPSMVEFEQIKTIDKSRIKGYLGKLTKEQLGEIDDYLKIKPCLFLLIKSW